MTDLTIQAKNNPANHPQPRFRAEGGLFLCTFEAMASDCEIVLEGLDKAIAQGICEAIVIETWRIEAKFSRYRKDNLIHAINQGGVEVEIDSETSALFEFADQCYQASGGLFDITSGVLRRLWKFDGGTRVPSDSEREAIKQHIGWDKVARTASTIRLQQGMEIDLGGIGKEYAVDRALLIAVQALSDRKAQSVLINFGGDLAATGARVSGEPWRVGIESAMRDNTAVARIELYGGAIATSGNANRYVIYCGRKLPHILNPITAWPVEGAPSGVSVAAPSCLHAGMLSTLSMLQGAEAESFLQRQGVQYWLQM